MTDRETTKVTTPIGKVEIELKTYLTGGERRSITAIFLSNSEFSIDKENPSINKLKGDVVHKAQDKSIETIIVSIGGVKENILTTILDMHETDFNFVVSEIDKVSSGLDKSKKK